jgi:hypothetical protein
MMEVEKMKSHQKGSLKLKCFSPLKIYTFPFIWGDSWSFFLYTPSLEDLEFWWYLRRKSLLQKPIFKWHDIEWHGHDYGYTDDEHIFQNKVMQANTTKLWLWRCESCGYIDGGRIFRSGGMHTNISMWG